MVYSVTRKLAHERDSDAQISRFDSDISPTFLVFFRSFLFASCSQVALNDLELVLVPLVSNAFEREQ